VRLLARLKTIIWKLLATVKRCILEVGKAEAEEMLKTFGENGVFGWVPEAKAWLRELNVIYFLGVMELFAHG